MENEKEKRKCNSDSKTYTYEVRISRKGEKQYTKVSMIQGIF